MKFNTRRKPFIVLSARWIILTGSKLYPLLYPSLNIEQFFIEIYLSKTVKDFASTGSVCQFLLPVLFVCLLHIREHIWEKGPIGN